MEAKWKPALWSEIYFWKASVTHTGLKRTGTIWVVNSTQYISKRAPLMHNNIKDARKRLFNLWHFQEKDCQKISIYFLTALVCSRESDIKPMPAVQACYPLIMFGTLRNPATEGRASGVEEPTTSMKKINKGEGQIQHSGKHTSSLKFKISVRSWVWIQCVLLCRCLWGFSKTTLASFHSRKIVKVAILYWSQVKCKSEWCLC